VERVPEIKFYFNSIPVTVGTGDMWFCNIPLEENFSKETSL